MKTPLYQWHVNQGAKMVSFAGYEMPINYPMGLMKEHLHTRCNAGLFDVSHMAQVKLIGAHCDEELEKLVPGDIRRLKPMSQCYSMLTNKEGGVIDDLMVLKLEDGIQLVLNANGKQENIEYLTRSLNGVEVIALENQALIALQGPMAYQALLKDIPDIQDLVYMSAIRAHIEDIPCLITRSGYTGEDGFEISCLADDVEVLVSVLCQYEYVEPIGLGARDSLRLEAGLCLYGNDLTEHISPIQANLKWTVSKERRLGDRANFPGADKIIEEIQHGTETIRVGFVVQHNAPVRKGSVIIDESNNQVGLVSSGGFSPSLKTPIIMAYVNSESLTQNALFFAEVRNKKLPLKLVPLPFVPNRYYK